MARIRIYQSHFNTPSPPAGKISVPVLRSVNLRKILVQRAGAMVASGCNQPDLWNPPVIVVQPITGWEFQQSPLVVRRRSADPESDDLSSEVIGPITAAPQSGWSIVLPDLPARRRQTQLAILDSLSLPLISEIPPQSWTVSLAELKQVRPRIGFADAAIDAESWSPLETVAAQPWGWSLPPPVSRRLSVVVPDDQCGLYNPPVTVTQPDSGWTVTLPELAPRKRLPQGEFTARIDRPTDDVVVGWTVELPDLPQRRKQALPKFAGRLDQPSAVTSAVSLGWVCELPFTRRFPPRAGVLAGAELAPQTINPSPYGWTVTTNDLPAFRRKQALPELSGRSDQPQQLAVGYSVILPDLPQFQRRQALPESAGRLDQPSAIQTQSLGWVAELPHITRGTNRGGTLAGAVLVPQTVIETAATGWDVVLPDLPQFRRKQARVENIARIDQPVTVVGIVFQEGWSIVLPHLPQFQRRQAFPELSGRIDQSTAAFQWGWSVVIPDVQRPLLRQVAVLVGTTFTPETVELVPVRWLVELPFLQQVRSAKGGIFSSFQELPQTEPSTAVTSEQTYFIANVGRFMGRRG